MLFVSSQLYMLRKRPALLRSISYGFADIDLSFVGQVLSLTSELTTQPGFVGLDKPILR
jgi:hypothetical protein